MEFFCWLGLHDLREIKRRFTEPLFRTQYTPYTEHDKKAVYGFTTIESICTSCTQHTFHEVIGDQTSSNNNIY